MGEPNVGKSSFNKYCSSRFEDSVEQLHEQIYGVSFAVKILKNIDINITLVVWNFTGQERYKTIQPHYMLGLSGILLLFDLTRKQTFEKLVDWIQFIRNENQDVPILLVGSKADLFHLKEISDSAIENLVNSHHLQGYYEVSFKTGLNVEIVIQKMAEILYQFKIEQKPPSRSLELKRPYLDKPLILDDQRILSEYVLTVQTIFDMVFDSLSNRIVGLERFLDNVGNKEEKLRQEWVIGELDKISEELTTQNKQIQHLLETPPLPLTKNLKMNLSDEWKHKRDILLYRILVFRDVFGFLSELQ